MHASLILLTDASAHAAHSSGDIYVNVVTFIYCGKLANISSVYIWSSILGYRYYYSQPDKAECRKNQKVLVNIYHNVQSA